MFGLLVLGASGCRTSQADVDALQAKVAGLGERQDVLESQLEASDQELRDLSRELEHKETELRRTRSVAEDLALRVAILEENNPPPKPVAKAEGGERFKVPLLDANTRGPSDALVTIVVFSDFQCPFCKRANPTVEQLMSQYAGKLRFAFMHNPLSFHKQARAAAIASEAAAKQGKFWKMHDLLFENAKDLSPKTIEKLARKARLNRGRFKRDLKSKAIAAKVDAHQALSTKIGARGTPTFYVNGRKIVGARQTEEFTKIIDEEIIQAQRRLDSGIPRSALYQSFIDDGRAAADP